MSTSTGISLTFRDHITSRGVIITIPLLKLLFDVPQFRIIKVNEKRNMIVEKLEIITSYNNKLFLWSFINSKATVSRLSTTETS